MSSLIVTKSYEDHIIHIIKYGAIDEVKHSVDSFVANGGSIDFQIEHGYTPLMIAARTGDANKVALMLSHGACVKKCDDFRFTVAHHAASTQNVAVIELLWKRGADFSSLSEDGYTPEIWARHCNQLGVARKIKQLVPLSHAYSQEFRRRKRLAHILELQGKTELYHPHPLVFEKMRYSLEGWHVCDFWHTLAKRLDLFFQKHPIPAGIDTNAIVEMCKHAATDKPELKQYHNHKPILINVGHTEHYSALLLWGKFAILCERSGLFGCEFMIRQIDPKKVDQPLIDKFKGLRFVSRETYSASVGTLFESILDTQQNQLISVLENAMTLGRQKIGNCAWTNSEGAIYALFVLQSVKHFAKSTVLVTTLVRDQNRLFDTFKEFITRYDVNKYLDHHIKKAPHRLSYPSEYSFLLLMQPKLTRNLSTKVNRLLSNFTK